MSPDHQKAYQAECLREYQEVRAANLAAWAPAPSEPARPPRPLALAPGSAIERAASAAAARIVHHPNWLVRADEAHALATKIILGQIQHTIHLAVDDECTCGGNPPESRAACPACLVWHRLYSSPNIKVSHD